MLLYPNAKINLGLSVVSKRSDGYHNLETVFIPIPGLHDELEVTPATLPEGKHYQYTAEGIEVDCPPEKNLIIRVYEKMRESNPLVSDISVRFRKNIPFGAGLGGGSADAACMALAVNSIFGLNLSNKQLEDIVSPLGADCAFFIENRPRFAEGIGNIFTEVAPALQKELNGKYILLVKPDCAVSTAAAYKGITPKRPETPLKEAISFPMGKWQRTIVNDFEESVFPQFPEIAAIKDRLLMMGANYAAMSGSGATVYGIFDKVPDTTPFNGMFCHVEEM